MGGHQADRRWAGIAVAIGVCAVVALLTIGSALDSDREHGGAATYVGVVLAATALVVLFLMNRRGRRQRS